MLQISLTRRLALSLFLACAVGVSSGAAQEKPRDSMISKPADSVVAIVLDRIAPNEHEVSVFHGNQRVALPDLFELLVVSSLKPDGEVARYVGGQVVVIRSQERPDEWELHRSRLGSSGPAWKCLCREAGVGFVLKTPHRSAKERPSAPVEAARGPHRARLILAP